MNQKTSQTIFNLVFPRTFTKEIDSETRGNKALTKKLYRKLEALKLNPFQGEKVENPELPKWRVWVGNSHRLMYNTEGNDIVLLKFVKKGKSTYK